MGRERPNPLNTIATIVSFVFFGVGLFFLLFAWDLQPEISTLKKDLSIKCAEQADTRAANDSAWSKKIEGLQNALRIEKTRFEACNKDLQAALQSTIPNNRSIEGLRSRLESNTKFLDYLQAQNNEAQYPGLKGCDQLDPQKSSQDSIGKKWTAKILEFHPDWSKSIGIFSVCALKDERVAISLEAPLGKTPRVMLFGKDGDIFAETADDAFIDTYHDSEITANPRIIDADPWSTILDVVCTPSDDWLNPTTNSTTWAVGYYPGEPADDNKIIDIQAQMAKTCTVADH